ncbi:hypothetical protein KC19_5G083400 [Ceratodon purpureus]|uniref:Uncharacterized protein n=1 Tax=Ceratodon purpureus TaxID=3225 RepID=A0A8T0HZ75_CERPU|nr:hypothetical protein KC19_5G083400 [Ceratodon purpureus]
MLARGAEFLKSRSSRIFGSGHLRRQGRIDAVYCVRKFAHRAFDSDRCIIISHDTISAVSFDGGAPLLIVSSFEGVSRLSFNLGIIKIRTYLPRAIKNLCRWRNVVSIAVVFLYDSLMTKSAEN